MFLFNTTFWDRLPQYFHKQDTYKDGNGVGLLQRYLGIFGIELDEGIIPYLENYIDELDPKTASNTFLTHLAYAMGNPLDIFSNASKFSLLLQYIISIYKIKGTTKSYEIYFKLLGLDAYIIEHFENTSVYKDEGNLYDDGLLYDSYCEPCSDYSIFFKDINQTCIPSTPVLGSPLTITPANWTFNILTLSGSNIASNTTNTAAWARYAGLLTNTQLYKVTFTVTRTGAGFTPAVKIFLGTGWRQFSLSDFTIGVPYTVYMYANGAQLEVDLWSSAAITGGDTAEIGITVTPATEITWSYILTPSLNTLLLQVVSFLEPIFAKLRSFNEAVTACETLTVMVDEQITIVKLDPALYDNAMDYDDANLYDEDAVISTTVINQP